MQFAIDRLVETVEAASVNCELTTVCTERVYTVLETDWNRIKAALWVYQSAKRIADEKRD